MWGWPALPSGGSLQVLAHLNSQRRGEGHPGAQCEQPRLVGGRLCSKKWVRCLGFPWEVVTGARAGDSWNLPLLHKQELQWVPLAQKLI